MRKEIKSNAPYTYLSLGQEKGQYDLFVLVQVGSNQSIEFLNPFYSDGHTFIMVLIKESDHQENQKFSEKHYQLTPQVHNPVFQEDDATIVIQVNKLDSNDKVLETQKNILSYQDADDNYRSEFKDQDIAYNCPYVFVEKPDHLEQLANLDGDSINRTVLSKAYLPFVIIPLRAYEVVGEHRFIPSNYGMCESLIVMKKIPELGFSYYSDLEINETIYFNTGQFENGFTATLLQIQDEEKANSFFTDLSLESISEKLIAFEQDQDDSSEEDGKTKDPKEKSQKTSDKKKKAKTRDMSTYHNQAQIEASQFN